MSHGVFCVLLVLASLTLLTVLRRLHAPLKLAIRKSRFVPAEFEESSVRRGTVHFQRLSLW